MNFQVILTDSTPIVVLEYGNLIPSTTTADGQTICVSEPAPTEPTTAVLSSTTTKPLAEKDQIAVVNSDVETSTVEQIPTTVNIIRCITSADDVPTIHIVDTLENEAVVKKIEGAFHSLNPADIKSIEELVNKSSVTSSANGNKEERISLSFLNAATILQQPKEPSEKCPDGDVNDGNDAFFFVACEGAQALARNFFFFYASLASARGHVRASACSHPERYTYCESRIEFYLPRERAAATAKVVTVFSKNQSH